MTRRGITDAARTCTHPPRVYIWFDVETCIDGVQYWRWCSTMHRWCASRFEWIALVRVTRRGRTHTGEMRVAWLMADMTRRLYPGV